MFCLNYVGCKQEQHTHQHQKPTQFCLNYVGCKLSRRRKFGRIRDGFVWTMWDVNYLPRAALAALNAFCLNYVGCKHHSYVYCWCQPDQFCLNYVGCKRSSFLLTLRTGLRFVWTMWDVNKVVVILGNVALRFCLNYVGCKQTNISYSCFTASSFVWTMWDVNRLSGWLLLG